jgi:hypothetical protein
MARTKSNTRRDNLGMVVSRDGEKGKTTPSSSMIAVCESKFKIRLIKL